MNDDDNARRYRALSGAARPHDHPSLHLIREDSETSLCGIPRVQLSAPADADAFVCVECLEWLPKRVAFSGVYPRIQR